MPIFVKHLDEIYSFESQEDYKKCLQYIIGGDHPVSAITKAKGVSVGIITAYLSYWKKEDAQVELSNILENND